MAETMFKHRFQLKHNLLIGIVVICYRGPVYLCETENKVSYEYMYIVALFHLFHTVNALF